jgi:hypothetical protein
LKQDRLMNDQWRMVRLALVTGCLALAGTSIGNTTAALTYEQVRDQLTTLAAGRAARIEALTATGQGREVLMLTLSSDHANADHKPALLITAGLDARHTVGVQTAIGVARNLIENHADLLNDVTVYVIPCANPDGLARNSGAVNYGHIGTLGAVDEDRDGATDEDGPSDLNGDGFITVMRRIDPPLDDTATHLPDPAVPRLLKKADKEKGERAIYSVYIEGLDADGDGLIAEDGPGMVDLDKNFMHAWPEHDRDAGIIQLSEPESAAIAKFVIDHRNIVEAITFGRHDNLINVPDGKSMDLSGEAPKDLDEGDVGYYKEMSKLFKDLTGQERAPKPAEDTAGSLHAWLYAQRGIPSFATVVWGRPAATELKEEKKSEEGAATQPDADDAKRQADSEDSQKSDDEKKESKKDDKPKPADEEAAEWLKYSDRDRNGEGFMDWKPFDHPTLGAVEIGGFVPGFQMNPPPDQLDTLAEKQTAFIVELIGRRPKLSIDGPTVKKLAGGLYEVRLGLINEGYLPTATAMARKARSIPPTVVRVSTPIENIVSGERVMRVWGVGGSGERWTSRWIIRVDDGSDITIDLVNPQLGDHSITVKAE